MAIETLTYRELATRLGVSLPAAKMRAKRAGWPISRGNDRKARVQVQTDELEAASPPRDGRNVTGNVSSNVAGHEAEVLRQRVAELERELKASQASLAKAEADRGIVMDDARADRERADASLQQLIATTEMLTGSLNATAAALEEMAKAEGQATAATAARQAEVDALRQEVEGLRRRGFWARIFNQ